MKRIFLLLITLYSLAAGARTPTLSVSQLTCEHKTNPVGIGPTAPRFSWLLRSTLNDVLQTAYEIRVATSDKFNASSIIWSSGKTAGGVSILQNYAGPALQSSTRYYWQVRVWDNKGNTSGWSGPAYFETGLLQAGDWTAQWIEPEKEFSEKTSLPPVYTRKTFVIKKKIARARVYVSARGLYEMHINGKNVTDAVLTPGWTSYNKRLQYQVFDVSSLLRTGDNAMGAILGEGWYRGNLAWGDNRNLFGKKLALLAQLVVWYADGSRESFGTDGTWTATNEGPIRFSGIYDGEVYDARKEMAGWDAPGYNEGSWWKVTVSPVQQQALVAQDGPFVKRIEEIKPVRIFRTPAGEWVADMGQNMVGWVKLKVQGPAGSTIRLTHAEVLDKQGNFYTANLRAAKQLVAYTLKGSGEEVFEPHFTFQGFRYVRIEGFPGEPQPANLAGIVVHSDMTLTSVFTTSNDKINQLQHNIIWGQKGNFVDVPTDCPQRDERLGWTGDAQAFVRTAAFNMDISGFFTKWLKDVAADQFEKGGVPFVVPDVLRNGGTSAGWGDVAVIAAWTIYACYGDRRVLEDQYPSMKKYVEYIRGSAGDSMIWKGGSVFGDWLYYHPTMDQHTVSDGHTDRDLIATAFFGYSTSLLSRAAGVLGNQADEKIYHDLFVKIREAFNREYVSPSGRIFSGSQTSYVLALMFDLLPEDKRAVAASYLVSDIKGRGNHLSTGFLGTPYLCHVLSRFGYDDVAYDLLFQETYPSWLYPVNMGATTIWERWDGIQPDSSFQDAGMNSFNHYAYGAIGEWMYRRVAGIDVNPYHPGYKHFFLQPAPGGRFTFVKASLESPYGRIVSNWEIQNGRVMYHVEIPANTTATVRLDGLKGKPVTVNGKDPGPQFFSVEGNDLVAQKGSGTYEFSWEK